MFWQRFEVVEVVGTFPYPRGLVRVLRDESVESEEEKKACAALETQVREALTSLVTLSTKLEERGGAAAAAAEALAAPSELLDRHDQAVLGGLYADATERWEAFSLGACDLVRLEYDAAVEALATRSASTRFTILLDHLKPAVAELSALTSLDSIEGFSGADPSSFGSSPLHS